MHETDNIALTGQITSGVRGEDLKVEAEHNKSIEDKTF